MSKDGTNKAASSAVGKDSFKEPASEPSEGADLMQVVLSKPRTALEEATLAESRINGIVIGTLEAINEQGQALVYFPGIPGDEPIIAISTSTLGDQDCGNEVALGFVNGNPVKPIILGLIHQPADPSLRQASGQPEMDVQLDGEKLTLSAEREITLKCGKSSITLTRAGKVIVKGAYISNYSTGVNRIKGGSVQIN